jgi:hypothetical protein
MKKTVKAFCQYANVDSNLIRAVIRQSGGWRSFQEHALDIANHGIAGGFSGWIYYTETCAFYAKNQQLIVALVESQASEYDYASAQDMVKSFRHLDATMSEIGLTLYGTKRLHDTQVSNALAWNAAEEVARAYAEWSCAECHK